jgi:hypothetical protein
VGSQAVVLFYSIHDMFELEQSLRARGIETKAIPTPRHLSSDCGTALRFPLDRRSEVETAVAESNLEIEAIHELPA